MKTFLKNIQTNWKSGLTVSLVSIPLSIALAISTGATPTEGLITAFWAGILGSLFGGSHFNIMGPTGALAGILVSYALVYGYEILPVVAVLSGILILFAYIFHLDKYIVFIPKSVIHGFTLGVAFIIGLGQINNALGLTHLEKSENFLENIWMTLQHLGEANWFIFSLFLIGVAFIFLWKNIVPKIPGPAVLSFLAIFFMWGTSSFFPEYAISLQTLGDAYPNIHALGFENTFFTHVVGLLTNKTIWILSFSTAVIAILETLLSGQIADSLTKTKFNRQKEVLGLAIANIGSGLMGGIPATAALARTALNIKSGGTHKTSAFLSSLFLAIIALFFLAFFKFLPMVVIASILVFVAIAMVEKSHFIHLIENEKISFALSLLVAVLVVVEDPIIGIMVGTTIALLIFVNKVSYGETEVLLWKNGKMQEALLKHHFLEKKVVDSDIVVYKISGTLTYINMPAHFEAIEKITGNKYVILSMRHSFYADIDGIDYLEEIIAILKSNNDTILLSGINENIHALIKKKGFYKTKKSEQKIYVRTSEAIKEILGK